MGEGRQEHQDTPCESSRFSSPGGSLRQTHDRAFYRIRPTSKPLGPRCCLQIFIGRVPCALFELVKYRCGDPGCFLHPDERTCLPLGQLSHLRRHLDARLDVASRLKCPCPLLHVYRQLQGPLYAHQIDAPRWCPFDHPSQDRQSFSVHKCHLDSSSLSPPIRIILRQMLVQQLRLLPRETRLQRHRCYILGRGGAQCPLDRRRCACERLRDIILGICQHPD